MNIYKIKNLLLVIVGNVFEFYNFILLALYAPYVSKVFFPGNIEFGLMFIYGVSFCGYLSRPIGALIFGNLADLYGRTKVLFFTVFATGIITTAIGILPEMGTRAYFSAIILILLRFLQGFMVSGEEGSAAVYLSEIAPLARRCLISSLVLSSVFLGILMASSICFTIEYFLTYSEMLSYGWRIPFLLSLPMSVIIIVLRKNIIRQQSSSKNYNTVKFPALKMLALHKMVLIKLILACSVYASLTCFAMVWTPNELKGNIPSMVFSFGLAYMMLAIPVFGWLSDKLKPETIFLIGVLLSTFCMPSILNMIFSTEEHYIYVGLFILYTIISIISAPIFSILVDSFEEDIRCSGVSFVFNTSISLFSGSFPLVATYVHGRYGVNGLSFLLCTFSLVGLFMMLLYYRQQIYDIILHFIFSFKVGIVSE